MSADAPLRRYPKQTAVRAVGSRRKRLPRRRDASGRGRRGEQDDTADGKSAWGTTSGSSSTGANLPMIRSRGTSISHRQPMLRADRSFIILRYGTPGRSRDDFIRYRSVSSPARFHRITRGDFESARRWLRYESRIRPVLAGRTRAGCHRGVRKQMRDKRAFVGGIGVYQTFVHVDTRGYNANFGPLMNRVFP